MHRTKTYLFRSLRTWAKQLAQGTTVDILQGVEIKYRGDDASWVQISIVDPPGSTPRWFTIKITENLS